MVGWLVGKLKWLLLICAVGGPIVAFACWQDGNRRREVMADGIATTASIESATRVKRRRGGTSYKLDLAWSDAEGQRHSADDVSISHEMARRIIVDDKLTVASLPIKYMTASANPDRITPSENLIVLDDTAHQEQTDQEMIYVGAGAGAAGMLGSALMFLPWRRRRESAPSMS